MTDKTKQEISALVDGELDAADYEALRDVLRQDEHRQRWHRYHLIGDTLKKQLPDTLNHDLFQRVHAALEAEPLILSPQANRPSVADSPSQDSASIAAIDNPRPRFWARPAIGLSVAASVAVAAVVATQLLNVDDDSVMPVPSVASSAAVQEQEAIQTRVAQTPASEPAEPQVVAGAELPSLTLPQSSPVLSLDLNDDEQWKRLDMFAPPQASPYSPDTKDFSPIPGLRPHAQVVRFGEQQEAQ